MNSARLALCVFALLVVQGCASWSQDPQTVVIRLPGDRIDQPPSPLRDVAPTLYPYAALSANVYRPTVADQASNPQTDAEFARACAKESKLQLPLGTAWQRFKPFPSNEDQLDDDNNLRVQLWLHANADAKIDELVVVFRGTEFRHGKDWKSNLRWFGTCEVVDHYTLTSGQVAEELQHLIAAELAAGHLSSDVKITTTGHSLGGGLAQHIAYAFKAPVGTSIKPAQVVAFDPSPVTGWSCIDDELRTRNARGLEIDRAYEKDEILSYLRAVTATVIPPSAENPAIRGLRFNAKKSFNPLSNHSMKLLACALAKSAFDSAAGLDLGPLESEHEDADRPDDVRRVQ